MSKPSWWGVLKKKEEDDEFDETKGRSWEDHMGIEDPDEDETDEERERRELEGEGLHGDIEGVSTPSEDNERMNRQGRAVVNEPMIDKDTLELFERDDSISRPPSERYSTEEELKSEEAWFQSIGHAWRSGANVQTMFGELLESVFLLGSHVISGHLELDPEFLKKPETWDDRTQGKWEGPSEEQKERALNSARVLSLTPSWEGPGSAVRGGRRPTVQGRRPAVALRQLLKLKNEIYAFHPPTNSLRRRSDVDDEDWAEKNEKIAELEVMAKQALNRISSDLGVPEDALLGEMARLLPLAMMDSEVAGGLGLVEDADDDDVRARIDELRAGIRSSTDEKEKKDMQIQLEFIEKQGIADTKERWSTLQKNRNKLYDTFNSMWAKFTTEVIDPVMDYNKKQEMVDTRKRYRDIYDKGLIVNPSGDVEADGSGIGYVSYHPELFNPEHKGPGGPLNLQSLVESEGDSLMALGRDAPALLDSHAAQGLLNIFGKAPGQSEESKQQRKEENTAMKTAEVKEWLEGVSHDSPIVGHILSLQNHDGSLNCLECGKGDPERFMTKSVRQFRLINPNSDRSGIIGKPGLKSPTMSTQRRLARIKNAQMEVGDLKNLEREKQKEYRDAAKDGDTNLQSQIWAEIGDIHERMNADAPRYEINPDVSKAGMKDVKLPKPPPVVGFNERVSEQIADLGWERYQSLRKTERPAVRQAVGLERENQWLFTNPDEGSDGKPLWAEQHEMKFANDFTYHLALIDHAFEVVKMAHGGPWFQSGDATDEEWKIIHPGFAKWYETEDNIIERISMMEGALTDEHERDSLADIVGMPPKDLHDYLMSPNSPLGLQKMALGHAWWLGSKVSNEPQTVGEWISPLDEKRKQGFEMSGTGRTHGKGDEVGVQTPSGERGLEAGGGFSGMAMYVKDEHGDPVLDEEGKPIRKPLPAMHQTSLPFAGPLYAERDLVTEMRRKFYGNTARSDIYVREDGSVRATPHWTMWRVNHPLTRYKGKHKDPAIVLNGTSINNIKEQMEPYKQTCRTRMENHRGQPTAASVGHGLPYKHPTLTPILRYGLHAQIDRSTRLTEVQKGAAKGQLDYALKGGDLSYWIRGSDDKLLSHCKMCDGEGEEGGEPCTDCGGSGSINFWEYYVDAYERAINAIYRTITSSESDLFEMKETYEDSGEFQPMWTSLEPSQYDLVDAIKEDVLNHHVSRELWTKKIQSHFMVREEEDGSLKTALRAQDYDNPCGLGCICWKCWGDGAIDYNRSLWMAKVGGFIPWDADDIEGGKMLVDLVPHYGDAETAQEQFAKEAELTGVSTMNFTPVDMSYECDACDGRGTCGGCGSHGKEPIDDDLQRDIESTMGVFNNYIMLGRLQDSYPNAETSPVLGQSISAFLDANPDFDPLLLSTQLATDVPNKEAELKDRLTQMGYSDEDIDILLRRLQERSPGLFEGWDIDPFKAEPEPIKEPFAEMRALEELAKNRVKENKHSLIRGGIEDSLDSDEDAVKQKIKDSWESITTTKERLKKLRERFGFDPNKKLPDGSLKMDEEAQQLIILFSNDLNEQLRDFWDMRGDPLVGEMLARTYETPEQNITPQWVENILGEDNYTRNHIEAEERRKEEEINKKAREAMKEGDWAGQSNQPGNIWVDSTQPSPVNNKYWIEKEELEQKESMANTARILLLEWAKKPPEFKEKDPERYLREVARLRSELGGELSKKEEARLAELDAKIERDHIPQMDWDLHDQQAKTLLFRINNKDLPIKEREEAERDLMIMQPYSKLMSKVLMGKGKNKQIHQVMLRFSMAGNLSQAEIEGALDKTGITGKMSWEPKPPMGEAEFERFMGKYELLNAMSDRYTQILNPIVKLAYKLEELGFENGTIRDIAKIAPGDPEKARKAINSLLRAHVAEDNENIEFYDFLGAEEPVGHEVHLYGPPSSWVLESEKLQEMMTSDNPKTRLEASEAYVEHMGQIPDHPTDEQLKELLDAGLVEWREGGVTYPEIMGGTMKGYGTDLMREWGFRYKDEVDQPGVLDDNWRKNTVKIEPRNRKFTMMTKPLDLNEMHPSVAINLAYAFLHGGANNIQIPSRMVRDIEDCPNCTTGHVSMEDCNICGADDNPVGRGKVGTGRVTYNSTVYQPHHRSLLHMQLASMKGKGLSQWRHMMRVAPNETIRMLKRGVTGHTNEEIANFAAVGLDANPFWDLNGLSTTDEGYLQMTAIRSKADMDLIRLSHQRDKDLMEELQADLVVAQNNADDIKAKKPIGMDGVYSFANLGGEDREYSGKEANDAWNTDFMRAQSRLSDIQSEIKQVGTSRDALGRILGDEIPNEVLRHPSHISQRVKEIEPSIIDPETNRFTTGKGITDREVETNRRLILSGQWKGAWSPGRYWSETDEEGKPTEGAEAIKVREAQSAHQLESRVTPQFETRGERLNALANSGISIEDEGAQAEYTQHLINMGVDGEVEGIPVAEKIAESDFAFLARKMGDRFGGLVKPADWNEDIMGAWQPWNEPDTGEEIENSLSDFASRLTIHGHRAGQLPFSDGRGGILEGDYGSIRPSALDRAKASMSSSGFTEPPYVKPTSNDDHLSHRDPYHTSHWLEDEAEKARMNIRSTSQRAQHRLDRETTQRETTQMPWDPDAPVSQREDWALTDYYGKPLPGHPDYEPPEDEGDDQVQASSDPIEIAWDALLKNIGLL